MGFSLKTDNYASIDIGSHTVRLMVATLREDGTIIPQRIERRTTRLATNFQEGDSLKHQSIQDSLAALRQYAEILQEYRVRSVACGATGVVRRARNGSEFLEMAARATGIQGAILSEDAEARLSAKGVISALPERQGLILIFDLGGSSTEFFLVDLDHGEALWSTSVFIGAATATEQYLPSAPAEDSQIMGACHSIAEALQPAISQLRALIQARNHPAALRLVGTAGTVTTLAAMHMEMTTYEPYRVNGLSLSEKWLAATIDLLAGMSLESRRKISGLETGREDIILGGALIVMEVLRGFSQNRFIVMDAGLLEGLLLSLIEKERGLPPSLLSPFAWLTTKR